MTLRSLTLKTGQRGDVKIAYDFRCRVDFPVDVDKKSSADVQILTGKFPMKSLLDTTAWNLGALHISTEH